MSKITKCNICGKPAGNIEQCPICNKKRTYCYNCLRNTFRICKECSENYILKQYIEEFRIKKEKERIEANNKCEAKKLYEQTVGYTYRHNHLKKIECLEKAIKLYPQFKKAWIRLGLLYGNSREFEKEIECYQKALKIDSQDKEVWHLMGVAYSSLKNLEMAIECLKKSIKIDPLYKSALLSMGDVNIISNNFSEAIIYFEKAFKIDPFDIDAIEGIKFCKIKLKYGEFKLKIKELLSSNIYEEITFERIAYKLQINKMIAQDIVEELLISGELKGKIMGGKLILNN
ncbi:MAG: tetratricopeptide repeat protein [Candidatus Helarchaeota archaeon]